MRNLETINGAKRLLPEVAGSNPVPEAELASVSTNGTNSTLLPQHNPQKPQNRGIDNTIDNKTAKNRPPQLNIEDRKRLFYSILSEGVHQ